MGRHQAVAKTYRRTQPVDWGRSVHRRRYMRRELTSVFLIAYALVLLFGLWRLSQGEAAFEAWRASWAIHWHWRATRPSSLPPCIRPSAGSR